MLNPARRAVALALLAAAIVAGAVALDLAPVAAQSDDEQAGRIVARRLDDGRTEFGWQPSGGARVLPRARYFPANAQVDRWLNSSPVEVDGAEIGRINARLRDDGRIEFAFTPTDGERILPQSRYFPVDARVGRWLRSTEIEISAAPAAGFVAVSAGGHWLDAGGHTCAIRNTGAIECWGRNSRGVWSAEGAIQAHSGQADAPTGSFTAVAAGAYHTCAIRESGAIECWGWSAEGQINAPAGRFNAVSAGYFHTCAIHDTGAIECWGYNADGQINAPAGSFTAVAAGEQHTCAIHESGEIECWGGNQYGLTDAPAGSFTAVAAGEQHTCAIRESGEIKCWGNNEYGATDAPASSFTAVSVGPVYTCGLRESGAIECWGESWRDSWGTPPAGRVSAISASTTHACAIREDGAIECWGWNEYGQTDVPAP